MDQELFNPQSSSVSSSRIIYTPSTFARTSLLHLQEVGSLQAVHPHVSQREDLVSFLCFIVLSGEGELRYEGEEFKLHQETVCSSTVGKRIAILHSIIFGRFSGVTSMHRLFRLCMRSTKSEAVDLCSTRRILNRSLHFLRISTIWHHLPITYGICESMRS